MQKRASLRAIRSVTGLASSYWLGDIEKMGRKMLGAFSSHFLNVGYS
ncbi:MAG: hypothetical protein KBA66_24125 [Leptospiraceae bacterium]|nr:hypothetical protein [Leptospiraceae bacterium]